MLGISLFLSGARAWQHVAMNTRPAQTLFFILILTVSWGLLPVFAADAPPDADELARKVYAVSHNEAFRNAISRRVGRAVPVVVNRVPLRMRKGRKPHVQAFDAYINNQPSDPAIDSMQMAILTSGKARGTGVLVTRYSDPARAALLSIWLPALRKARNVNEPSHEDVWFGTNLTYGELVLRQPDDETHEYLGEAVFEDCLGSMVFQSWERNRHTELLPPEQCSVRGKAVLRLKSTTKFPNWWYDYHITEIDRETYWPYRTVYFKGDRKIKTIEVDWQSLQLADATLAYPRYIYALSLDDGRDSMVYVPRETIGTNVDLADDYWSIATIRDYLHK